MKWWSGLLLAMSCFGQVEAEWDLKKLLAALTAEAQRVKPVLDRADPKDWSDASAASSYAPQFQTAQKEIGYLNVTAAAFAKQPERLTLALESFFRLESMERTLDSFGEGLRRYGNPAVADLLTAALRENSSNRERLRQYITELANNKEQEFRIADEEAQRCRGAISRQPPARKK